MSDYNSETTRNSCKSTQKDNNTDRKIHKGHKRTTVRTGNPNYSPAHYEMLKIDINLKMQIKTTVRCHLTSIYWAKFRNLDNTKCRQE